MHISIKLLSLVFVLGLIFTACKKDPEEDVIIKGCKDPLSDNFNAKATEEDGSCTYQKRFISKYDINVLCGQASAIFQNASMEITDNTKKDRVNFVITSLAGNIVFDGVITKDSVKIDTIIKGLELNAKQINTNFEDIDIKADVKMKAHFALSLDAKKLAGDMDVEIRNSEDIIINGIPVPAGQGQFPDKCTFTGTKK